MRNLKRPLEPARDDFDAPDNPENIRHREAEVIPIREPRNAESAESGTSLLPPGEAAQLYARWERIQSTFVDEPGRAVEDADKLAKMAISRVSELFSDERKKLEDEWTRGGEISTEHLRIALKKYRSFFTRLLSL